MSEGKPRILFVDDEPGILQMYGKRLEAAGFDILTAGDGEEALTRALQSPKLIILDLTIPKRSGLDVCSTLRKDPRYNSVPIILFTGKEDDDVLSRFGKDETLLEQWGADAYVQKTDGPAALLDKVTELLSKPRTS